jgi:signal transduction histidine kinase
MPMLVDLGAWPAIVLTVDAEGIVVASNGVLESLLGQPVIALSAADVIDTESSGRKWARMCGMRTSDAATTWELVLRGADRLLEPRTFMLTAHAGNRVLVELPVDRRIAAMSDEVGQVNSDLANAQRTLVKEQRRLAHALADVARSNAALDEFAHAVSHDLKAPLRAIIDYADLLAADASASLSPEHHGYVQRLATLSLQMRSMIDAVLSFARAGRASSEMELVDTRKALQEIVGFLAPPADVSIELAPDLPTFELQRVPFEQVFRNLLSNAIKYRRRGDAHVRVTAEETGFQWEFVVSDNGPGIPPLQHDRIWQLFQTSTPGDGTGIGLALVKRIVEAQGGSVGLESDGNAGARFRVSWPKQHGRRASDASRDG